MRIGTTVSGGVWFAEEGSCEWTYIDPSDPEGNPSGRVANNPEEWYGASEINKELTPAQVDQVLEGLKEIINAL